MTRLSFHAQTSEMQSSLTCRSEKMDEVRERMLEMANKAKYSEQPLSWFEDLYRSSNRNRFFSD